MKLKKTNVTDFLRKSSAVENNKKCKNHEHFTMFDNIKKKKTFFFNNIKQQQKISKTIFNEQYNNYNNIMLLRT